MVRNGSFGSEISHIVGGLYGYVSYCYGGLPRPRYPTLSFLHGSLLSSIWVSWTVGYAISTYICTYLGFLKDSLEGTGYSGFYILGWSLFFSFLFWVRRPDMHAMRFRRGVGECVIQIRPAIVRPSSSYLSDYT